MTQDRFPAALRILQWALGLVILEESLRFAFSPGAAQAFAKTGMPNFIHLTLAYTEIVAAILFLVPRATVIGGWLLIVVLASAIVLHLLHGWFDVGALVVYAAAAWAVVEGSRPQHKKRT
ncbi:MAG: hypothetical protein ABSG07_05410 [Terriglobales bacterium]|jgi:hypothetical protein